MATVREFLQLDARDAIDRIGTEQWVVVYSHCAEGIARTTYYCALVADRQLSKAVSHESWDLSIGDGAPGCSRSYASAGEPETTYHRFVTDEGIEPLVFERHFHGIKPDYLELLEEFRHFHALYHDQHNNRYIRILDSGEEEVIAEVQARTVRIKTRAVRQFLAVKRMHLLVFFDIVVEGDVNLEDIDREARAVQHSTSSTRYAFHVADNGAVFSDKPLPGSLERRSCRRCRSRNAASGPTTNRNSTTRSSSLAWMSTGTPDNTRVPPRS